MSDFVRQPLLKKLNRENIITRIIKLEQQNGARASQSAGQLGHISGRTGILYVDELIAGANGEVVLDSDGVFLQNSSTAWFNFEDASGGRGTINIAADPNNDFEFVNLTTSPQGTISFFLKIGGVVRRLFEIASTFIRFNENKQDVDFWISTVNQTFGFMMDAAQDKSTSFSWDGWALRDETWTRTGNHTFTISSATDLTPVFRKGTKIRYQDGGAGNEYGVVGSSTFAASVTTVNLIPNTDYAMAAATITSKYISYIENPEGFPGWFNWDANPQGFSVVPSSQVYQWFVTGNLITLNYDETVDGTSNATTFTATAPIAATYAYSTPLGTTVDNGVVQTTPGRIVLSAGSTTITFRKDSANGAWTNVGGKRAIGIAVYRY